MPDFREPTPIREAPTPRVRCYASFSTTRAPVVSGMRLNIRKANSLCGEIDRLQGSRGSGHRRLELRVTLDLTEMTHVTRDSVSLLVQLEANGLRPKTGVPDPSV
jgi:hypothetical protein